MPGRIGMFCYVYGLCGIVRIFMGRKKSSRKWPCSWSYQAKLRFYTYIKWCIKSHSIGSKKSPGCAWSMTALCSLVYWPVGVNGSGWVGSFDMSFKRLPLMLWVILNQLGSLVSTGQTLSITDYTSCLHRWWVESRHFEWCTSAQLGATLLGYCYMLKTL